MTIFGGPIEHLETATTRQILREANIPFFELHEVDVPAQEQTEFIHIISKICGIGKLPAIFAGYKYVGGLDELKDLKNRGLLEDVMR